MFVSFLMPHVDRGAGPLFHLIMLLQMSRFAPDEIGFIGDDAYFNEAHVPFGEELALGSIRFTCVSQERFRAYRKASVPFGAVASLYAHERNHLDAFQALLTDVHAPLTAAITSALDELAIVREEIEAFLTWSNCPSLSALAAELGKPVIHNELGPLRGPFYQDTVYFDFRGVNGNTTPALEWMDPDALATRLDGLPCLTVEALRQLLCCGPMPAGTGQAEERYPLGVALQVEDDSNTLAYGRGYDAIRLLYQAQRNLAPERVLVRSHPGARMGYRGGLGQCDDSPTSLAFLQRIDHLMTINSSVAAEAALWNVPCTVLGDTPFSLLSVPLSAFQGAAAKPGNMVAVDLGPGTDTGTVPPAESASETEGRAEEAPELPASAASAATPADTGLDIAPPGAEAALPGPSTSIPAAPAAVPNPVLNALLLGYLVPSTFLFDPDYYRWRLAGATLRDCVVRHLEVFKRNATHVRSAVMPGPGAPAITPTFPAATPAAADVPHRNAALWTATRSLSRSTGALQKRIEALETELAATLEERDKNWKERCWFQTNMQRLEQELQTLRDERDTLRLALAQQAAVDALAAETQTLLSRYGQMEHALVDMQRRFDKFSEELAQANVRHTTAEAQGSALLDELYRTQRERIEAFSRGLTEPPT